MKRFAVIGQPIQHSLSPAIHQSFAAQFAIELRYQKHEVSLAMLSDWVNRFFMEGGIGLNVTLPLKEAAYALAAQAHPQAKQAQAANTLWQDAQGMHADNTDGIGLVRDLARYVDLHDARILILGAGGAARGILPPLLQATGKSICIANRTIERARMIQQQFSNITVLDWHQLSGAFDLIINATSAGLQPLSLPIKAAHFQDQPFGYDLSYQRDSATPFLQQCQSFGWKGVDGLGMLVEQAAESFTIWHGVRPQTDTVIDNLRCNSPVRVEKRR